MRRSLLVASVVGAAACGSSSTPAIDASVMIDAAPAVVDAVSHPPDAPLPIDAPPPDTALPVDAPPPDATLPIDAPPVYTGDYHHYVTSTLKIGSSVTEADSYAFNLDCDPRNVPDDELGKLLAGLSNMISIDPAIAASIQSGQTVLLHSIRADALTSDPTASWQVFLGEPQANPVLTGGGNFSVDPTGPTTAILDGAINGGQYAGGPRRLTLRFAVVPGQPIDLPLVGARLQASCTADGCTGGRIGGGILASDMMTKVIPAMAGALNATIMADGQCATMCQTSGACSSSDQQLLDLFDTNMDCVITADELESSSLIAAVLQPDVDLLDADGNPCGCSTGVACDGVAESVSFAVGFTAASAVFTAPGEH